MLGYLLMIHVFYIAMYKGLMVSVKLGSMDPDVLHYMQILNRYKGPSDGKCKIRVDGPRCFTLHANFE